MLLKQKEVRLLWFVLLGITLLSACKRTTKDDGIEPQLLFPQPKIVEANLKDGYTINQLTSDSIAPIILESGDTVKTGIPIPVIGKTIDPDSVAHPKSFKIPPESQLTQKDAHPNRHKIPKDITKKPINNDSLTKIKLTEIPKNDTLHYFINLIGDTLKTGVPISAKGINVITTQPQPSPASTPVFKDASNVNVKYLDVDQGLNSSYIWTLLEDQKGNLWFGTDGGGVSRYNGETFTNFTEKEGLSNNSVLSMLEDQKGNLWFGTGGGGVSMYDGETFTNFTQKEGLTNNSIWSILEDQYGNIWFGTNGGGVSMYNGESFTHFTEKEGLSSNYIESILEDNNGNLWFGTYGGGVSRYSPQSSNGSDLGLFTHFTEKEGLSSNSVWSILEDQNGNIWFGTNGGGVTKFNGESFTHFTEKEGLSNNSVLSIVEDKSGKLWFGTNGGGVSIYNPQKANGKDEYFIHLTQKEGLSNNIIGSIVEDKSGSLWFATYGGGVSIYNGDSFTHFTEKEGLSNNVIRAILEDQSGNLWFGSDGGGVNMYNGETFTHFTEKEGLSNNIVKAILEDKDGNIWFGTHGAGISMYNGETFTNFTEKEGLSNNSVGSILEDKSGNLWFGTYGGGVSMYNGKFFTHFTQKEGLPNNFIGSILEDQRGNIWIGTNGGGVSMFNPEVSTGKSKGVITHFTEREGLSNNSVRSILEDQSGRLWFATYGGGICMYNQEVRTGAVGESFTYFTQKEGLPDNSIWSILEDKNGHIWASTEKGLTCIMHEFAKDSSKEKELNPINFSLQSYTKNDGLKGIDFRLNSRYIDSKNRIWWGSGKSITMLDMNKFSLATKPPTIYLKQLDINEQFIDYRNITDSLGNEIQFKAVQRFENYPLNLTLPYDKNHLTFHFVGIDWSAPHKIQYSYRMLGLDNNWSNPTKEAKAEYRNLPYGTYTFQLRAIGESQEWSEPFKYTFTIHPPWWHTWWARALYALFALALILTLIKRRTHKLKLRQLELETEVDNATKEIKQQKEEVEQKNKEILDSITYAKRLQDAILPPTKQVKSYLLDSFIFYKPKDIVAGDFYFMDVVENENKKLVYYVAADCTGHGVPGAMVSIVGANGLKRCIQEFNLRKPGEILDKLAELVAENFSQSEERIRDGVDLALCCLEMENNKTKKIHYAGANNPLWVINPKRKSVPSSAKEFKEGEGFEIKANKQAIGYTENISPFTTHTFDVEEGDTLYTFSDGYPDQFGGEKGKKYKSANFRKFLLSIQDQNMDEQKKLVNEEFESWKGSLEQIDDVCVIGVRL